MSETTTSTPIDQLELAEKILKIANLHADTELKDTQRHFLPWQFAVSALAVGITAGFGIAGGLFTLIKWHFGG